MRNEIKLYSPAETAKMLAVTPNTLAFWRSQPGRKALPFVKLGKYVRYRHRDIYQWIDSNLQLRETER